MYLHQLQQMAISQQKIAIIGLARENRQFLQWLVEVVGFPTSQILLADQLVWDQLTDETRAQIQKYQLQDSQLFLGQRYLDVLHTNVQLVFKSPGIWSLKPEFEKFRDRHGPASILSGLVYFLEKYRQQIIGVTGTKGKSTTSNLIAHLLNQIGQPTNYCGNTTNISPYTYWTNLEQTVEPTQFFVVELSSFQLQDLAYSQVSPKYAVITNYFVDHLDHHADTSEYWGSKDALFLYQKPGDFCLVGPTVLTNSTQSELLKDKTLTVQDVQTLRRLFRSPLRGEHNWSNLAQALLTAQAVSGQSLDANQARYQQAIDNYQSLAHRLQLIRSETIGNLTINFFDDGYATDPAAVAAAVRALSQQPNEYLWLMLTGKDKGTEVEDLFLAILDVQQRAQLYRVEYCGAIGQKVLAVFNQTLGLEPPTATSNFRQTVSSTFTNLTEIANNFQQWYRQQQRALRQSPNKNQADPIVLNVLLSPGGSSFDEFTNQQERAEWWVQKVLDLQ